MSDKVDIFFTCVAVYNPKAKEAINGVSLVYQNHKDNQNPSVSQTENIGFLSTLSEIFSLKDQEYHQRFYPLVNSRMSVDTSTALGTFKDKYGIMSACIFKSKSSNNDDRKMMEPYLVEVYESMLKLYNYHPDYIVNEIVKNPKQVSVGAMNENITYA